MSRKRRSRKTPVRRSALTDGVREFQRSARPHWRNDAAEVLAEHHLSAGAVARQDATEVQVRLTFAPFRVQADCLAGSGAHFVIALGGQQMRGVFEQAKPRSLMAHLQPDPSASFMMSGVEIGGFAETDCLFLLFRFDGDMDDAKEFMDSTADEIEAFRIRLERWGDVLSEQGPSPLIARRSPRIDSMLRSGRKTVGYDSNTGPYGLTSMMRISMAPGLDLEGVSTAIDLALQQQDIPMAWQMLKLAGRSEVGGEFRIAVTEAGVAAELALAQTLIQNSDLSASRIARWTLGTLCHKLIDESVAFPGDVQAIDDVMRDVVNTRNDAVHRGVADVERTSKMLEVTEGFVKSAFPLPLGHGGAA